MSVTVVQHASNTNIAVGAPSTFAYPADVAKDDLLIVGAQRWGVTTVTSVTDTQGNTWFQGAFEAAGTDTVTWWWTVAGADGPCTVTVAFANTAIGGRIGVGELSGFGPGLVPDGSGAGISSSGATVNLPAYPTATDGELVVNFAGCAGSGAAVVSPWTEIDNVGGNPLSFLLAGAAGSYAPNTSQTSAGYESCTGAIALAQVLEPNADITTTGWSATPLFSKLNDGSDATFVTATAA